MYIMPSEAGSPSRMMALLEPSLNATGLEVERGPLKQTPPQRQPQNKPKRERGTGKGCSVGDGHTKNLRPRKVIERNTEKRGAPDDIRGTAQGETDPHTGIGRKKDGEAADRFGHKEQKVA